MHINLENRTALVTGASRGIGRDVALALGHCAATVIGTATTPAGAAAITKCLADAGVAGRGVSVDVTDGHQIDEMMAGVTAREGPPSILVNNAGITRDNLLLRMKEEEWDAIMDTNLKSLFRMTRACLRPMMKARFGRIINISSVVGVTGNPGQSNYAAAKAGAVGFTRAMAQELAPRGITVNAVAPGLIDTDMTRGLNDDQRAVLLGKIPLGRLGQPADVAAAVVFLASDQASYITGVTLHVNGGMYMN